MDDEGNDKSLRRKEIMELIQQNIALEQIKYDQGISQSCGACKQRTLQYRLTIAELIMRQAGLYSKDTTPEDLYQFAMRNIEDTAYCYKCLLKKSAE